MIKRFIIAFILLALVGGGIVGFNMFRDNAIKQYFATMKPPAVTVSTTDRQADRLDAGRRGDRHGQRGRTAST